MENVHKMTCWIRCTKALEIKIKYATLYIIYIRILRFYLRVIREFSGQYKLVTLKNWKSRSENFHFPSNIIEPNNFWCKRNFKLACWAKKNDHLLGEKLIRKHA